MEGIHGAAAISDLPYRSGGQVRDSHTTLVNSSLSALAFLSRWVEALGEPVVGLGAPTL